MTADRIAERMAALRAKFVAELAGDRAALQGLRNAPAADPELCSLLHRLAGRAGTFGFPDISEMASSLETLCLDVVADSGANSDRAPALFDALDHAIAAALRSAP